MSRILVAGELNADLVMTGLPSLPVLGRELTSTGFRITLGSSSAITAARLAALGAPTDFVGRMGGDDLGRFVLRELQGFGVGTAHIQIVPEAQTDVTIALTYAHDRALLTYPGLMTTFNGATLTPELLAEYAHLHVGSFFLQPALQPELPRLFRLAHDSGLTTSLDTGWDPQEQWMQNPHLRPTLAETDYFFPNESELAALCGGEWNPPQLAEFIRGTLVIKCGAKGALAMRAGGEAVTMPAFVVEAIDTTGAGDAFNAGFVYTTIVARGSAAEALRFAAACGAQAVTQVGGATNAPSAEMIQQWLKRPVDKER
jgi:sugar/nucleoside kinase (ribokinase family)